jgi:hypothetical protein
MWQLAGAGKLSPDALRGALLASKVPAGSRRTPIPLERAARFARSPAELEFVLETFAQVTDAQIEGSFDLLRDATSSDKKWQGTVWQMEVAKLIIGIEKISAFEVRVVTESGRRDVDIRLRDGRMIETKDWSEWWPDKVDEQFNKDLERDTDYGRQPDGLRKIRWLFRHPPPVSLARVRAQMRATLERFIVKQQLGKAEADAMRDAFDAHLDLLQVPELDRTQVAKPPAARVGDPRVVPPPPPRRKDDEP